MLVSVSALILLLFGCAQKPPETDGIDTSGLDSDADELGEGIDDSQKNDSEIGTLPEEPEPVDESDLGLGGPEAVNAALEIESLETDISSLQASQSGLEIDLTDFSSIDGMAALGASDLS